MRDQEYTTAREVDRESGARAEIDRVRDEPRGGATDVLGMLAEVAGRLKKVEADNADMRATIDGAKKSGDLDLDTAHMVHVLQKYFPHDRPEDEVAAPPAPKFDAFTGQPLN